MVSVVWAEELSWGRGRGWGPNSGTPGKSFPLDRPLFSHLYNGKVGLGGLYWPFSLGWFMILILLFFSHPSMSIH